MHSSSLKKGVNFKISNFHAKTLGHFGVLLVNQRTSRPSHSESYASEHTTACGLRLIRFALSSSIIE
jgi:hypothetical protein